MTAIATVGQAGAETYGERNWEQGFQYSTIYSSLMRHLLAWWEGETLDPETFLPHTYHIAWNAHALVEHERRLANGSLPEDTDDRPCCVVPGYHSGRDVETT